MGNLRHEALSGGIPVTAGATLLHRSVSQEQVLAVVVPNQSFMSGSEAEFISIPRAVSIL